MSPSRNAQRAAALSYLAVAGFAIAATNPDPSTSPTKPVSAAKAAQAARKLAQEERTMPANATPMPMGSALMLNLRPLFRTGYATVDPSHARFSGFGGQQVIDGVPLQIEGDITLHGRTLAERSTGEARFAPRLIRGIQVGRAFDELHLLHAAVWPDLEGRPIAVFTLHYRDGTSADLPIVFGGHVRDGTRLLTEETETLTDPDTKIVWRGPGPGTVDLHATSRLFKSLLRNPHPENVVDTIDLKSADEPLAAYRLIAATVTNRDANRPTTPPLPLESFRQFDGQLTVRVRNAADGQPLANAVIDPAMKIEGVYSVGTLLVTSPQGEAIIRYPSASTTEISVRANKDGSFSPSAAWRPGASPVLELTVAAK